MSELPACSQTWPTTLPTLICNKSEGYTYKKHKKF